MKRKILYISFLMASTFATTSCEDFLNVDSPSSFDADYLFSTTDDAYKMVLGAYAPFAQDPYTSRMSNVFMQSTDVEGNTTNDEAADGAHRRDVWSLEGGVLENWGDIKKAWDNTFLAIDRANQCIQGIENSELYKSGDPTMRHLLGESYCIRAYWYWMACNFWGDVPFSTTPSTADKDNNTPRVDKNVIYSQCIQDLINHYEMMLSSKDVTVERMNREFALGMIVRLSMFRAGYSMQKDGTMKRADDYQEYLQIACKYADILINKEKSHTLDKNFAQIFKDECQFKVNNEGDILYEVAFVQNGGGDVGWCIGRTASGSYGSGSTYINLLPTYFYSFDRYDLRRDATCDIRKYKTESVEEPTGINGIMPVKWCRLWLPSSPGVNSSKGTGINWPLMRLSDVMLMYAEALNELNGGPNSEAQDMLRQVRQRAFSADKWTDKVENYISNLNSKDDFFNAIVNERAWEFGGECLRKFDLVRWNIYGQKILEVREELTNMGKAGVEIETENPEVQKYMTYPNHIYYTLVTGKSDVTGNTSASVLKYKNDYYTRLTDEEAAALKTVSKYDNLKVNDGNYVRMGWLSSLMTAKKDADGNDIKDPDGNRIYEPAKYIVNMYRGFKGTSNNDAVPYLLPIPYEIIVASSGILSNDGYGLTK